MASIQVLDVIRIVARLEQYANAIQNVYHCLITGGVLSSDPVFINDTVGHIENAYGFVNYGFADNVIYDDVTFYNLTQDYYMGQQAFGTLTQGGGGTNPMLPPQTSPLVLLRTSAPKSLGKKFLAPCTDNVLDDNGTPTAGLLTNMASFASQFVGTVTGSTGMTFVFGTYTSPLGPFRSFVSGEARDLFATQRRRYTGRGI